MYLKGKKKMKFFIGPEMTHIKIIDVPVAEILGANSNKAPPSHSFLSQNYQLGHFKKSIERNVLIVPGPNGIWVLKDWCNSSTLVENIEYLFSLSFTFIKENVVKESEKVDKQKKKQIGFEERKVIYKYSQFMWLLTA